MSCKVYTKKPLVPLKIRLGIINRSIHTATTPFKGVDRLLYSVLADNFLTRDSLDIFHD